uniref:Hint domain-containing protein n=1 Tax=Compsopogon caeruleus TaxID=31354 RepID=A0A7S1T707_9RHOD|mmetsp:Transcript_12052/g.24539  ORF Transcript_12052/g.24539 Transcript_12052/m.24539 type:complete len:326 (+) Transcript_12052:92-1069(+)
MRRRMGWIVVVVSMGMWVAESAMSYCTCRYSTDSCLCGSNPCETTVPLITNDGCGTAPTGEGYVNCRVFCGSTGLDWCKPSNCKCVGCPAGVLNDPSTATDSVNCQKRCQSLRCQNSTFSENILAVCTGDGAQVVFQQGARYCFSSRMKVERVDGTIADMSQLKIGDRVRSSKDTFSEVFAFTHQDPDATAEFLQLTLSNGQYIELSPGHYLVTDQGLLSADSVQPGQLILGDEGQPVEVFSSRRVHSEGVFNPQTLDGTIVVNGVVCSTYTRAVHPRFAAIVLFPLRVGYRLGHRRGLGELFRDQRTELLHTIPVGPARLATIL